MGPTVTQGTCPSAVPWFTSPRRAPQGVLSRHGLDMALS